MSISLKMTVIAHLEVTSIFSRPSDTTYNEIAQRSLESSLLYAAWVHLDLIISTETMHKGTLSDCSGINQHINVR